MANVGNHSQSFSICILSRHFEQTNHTYSLDVVTRRVWDYAAGTLTLTKQAIAHLLSDA